MKLTRFKVLFFLIVGCFLLAIAKVFSIEVLNLGQYKRIYATQIQPTIVVEGKRGLIFDSRDKILAENTFLYDIFVDPKYYIAHNNHENSKFLNFIDNFFKINIRQLIQKNPQKQYINLGIIPAKYFFFYKKTHTAWLWFAEKTSALLPLQKRCISHYRFC
jgi:cell division protein FtsI/penicillin-binding protein 2